MAFLQYRFSDIGEKPYDKNTGVDARIVNGITLEYTAHNAKVVPGGIGRPMLLENMIHKKNVSIDVMEGYNPGMAASVNQHSIYHLYEFESQTKFLDNIPRPLLTHIEFDTRFLCCRYVVCGIDDWMTRRKSIELLAIRKNGDITIGSNKLSEVAQTAESNEAAFGGLNFAKKVTSEMEPTNFQKHHSVVKHWRVENKRSRKSMNIFVSSVARAFDATGNVVELKTVGSKVMGKLQNLPGPKARNWWLRALLSGANRIVYGLRMDDLTVNEILEASIDEFTNGHFHFTQSRLFTEVYKIFEKIDKTIVNEGEMCLVSLNIYEPMRIIITTSESLSRSPFW